jgi:hypothetical protein
MLSELFLFAGLLAVCFGLRSIQHPLIFRLGHLGLVATTYLFGYRISGSHAWGSALATIWFLLPWIDILGRVRGTQLPASRTFAPQPAPSPRRFPELEELTEEAEAAGFVQVEDYGWNHEDQRHSMRVLVLVEKRIQATIHFVESEDAEFFYVSLTSRRDDGELWTTWNYPFLLSLKPSPRWRLRTRSDAVNFQPLLEMHTSWIGSSPNQQWSEVPVDSQKVLSQIEIESDALVSHNLQCGVLTAAEGGMVRYTLRGCFFIWFQFLRDLVGVR